MPQSRRRRPSYHVEAEITPSAQPAPNWMAALGGVPIAVVLTVVASGIGFYTVTNYKLTEYDKDISTLKAKVEAHGPAMAAKIDGEAAQRTAIRNEFMANANKTTEILGSIASRLAVSETKQEATNKALDTTNSTLSKIADQLQQLNSRTGSTRQ